MVEWRGFAPELVQLECSTAVPSSVEVLRLQAVGSDAMVLGVLGTPHHGQPPRLAILEALRLLPGQWARISLNARHTSYSGQHYSEMVFNVALGETIPGNRFIAGAPTHELDLQANLF